MMTTSPRDKSRSERRTRILLALDDGEFRESAIAAWADLSDRQTRADLKWLDEGEFVVCDPQFGERRWYTTVKGRAYLAGLCEAEKTW